jgi:predicted ArsR family transcriptional regulator
MFLKVIRDIAKPQWFDIVMLLKRSVGLSVAELAKALGMSYMGVKQHCIELEKRGYVDTWRRAKEIGRPEKAYRLTEKANALFPDLGSELTLEILTTIQATSGANAAEKLLFAYFQKKGKAYETRLKEGSLVERAGSLARLRDKEGRLSRLEIDPENGQSRMVEFHDPLRAIASAFGSIYHMEEQMLERVLGCSVKREEETASGLTHITYRFA